MLGIIIYEAIDATFSVCYWITKKIISNTFNIGYYIFNYTYNNLYNQNGNNTAVINTSETDVIFKSIKKHMQLQGKLNIEITSFNINKLRKI